MPPIRSPAAACGQPRKRKPPSDNSAGKASRLSRSPASSASAAPRSTRPSADRPAGLFGRGVYWTGLESGARRALACRSAWKDFHLRFAAQLPAVAPTRRDRVPNIVVYRPRQHCSGRLRRARTATSRMTLAAPTTRLPYPAAPTTTESFFAVLAGRSPTHHRAADGDGWQSLPRPPTVGPLVGGCLRRLLPSCR